METRRIGIRGINIQDADSQAPDGFCEELTGLIPVGSQENPQWAVNWHGLKVDINIYSSGDTFLAAHFYNDFLFLFVKITGNHHQVWKLTKSSGVYSVKKILLTVYDAGSDFWKCNFVPNKQGFWVSIIPTTSGKLPRQYYYNPVKDILVPDVLPLLGNDFQIATNQRSTTQTNYLRDYPNADQPGFLRNKDKFYAFIFAFRLKNGKLARHSQPHVVTVQQSVDASEIRWVDFTITRYNFLWQFRYKNQSGGPFTVGQTIQNSVFSNATIVSVDLNRKLITIAENTPQFVRNNGTFSATANPDNGATATFDGELKRIWQNMRYTTDNRSFFDQAYAGLRVDGSTEYNGTAATVDAMPVTDALLEAVDSIEVYMSFPEDTRDQAITAGTFYYAGSFNEETVSIDVKLNEELLLVREVMEQDPFSHHWHVGRSLVNLRERIVLAGVYNNFGIPMLNYIKDNSPGTADFLVWACVRKNDREYFIGGNINNIALEDGTIIQMPRYVTYPDRDCVRMDFWWNNGGNYELAYTYNMKPHPFLNLAYFSGAAFDYTKGTSTSTTTPSDQYLIESFYEPEEFKVGDLQKSYYPLLQTYKVDSHLTILGAAENLSELGEGQFGEFPLYILTNKGVFAAEQGSGDVLFSRIVKLSSEHGIINEKSFVVKNGYLWAADDKKLWALRGSSFEEIHWPILNNGENISLFPIQAVGNMLTQDVIIFAGARLNFAYNTRYGTWYTYRPKGINYSTVTGYVTGYQFFEHQGKSYELAGLIGNQAQSNNALICLDDQTKTTQDVYIKLKTKKINLDASVIYKSLKAGIIRGSFSPGAGQSIVIRVYGHNFQTTPALLLEYTITNEIIKSPIVRTNYGSMQSYSIEIEGTVAANSQTIIEDILIQYVAKTFKLKP